jgi:flagellar protein FliO/FliZ
MGGASTFELVLRLVVSLGVVLAIMAGAAMVMRRKGLVSLPSGGGRRRTAPLEVLSRTTLGRSQSLALVRAGDRALVLGITEHQVTLLLDSPTDVLDLTTPEAPGTVSPVGAATHAAAPSAWTAALEALRDRTARRS